MVFEDAGLEYMLEIRKTRVPHTLTTRGFARQIPRRQKRRGRRRRRRSKSKLR